MTHNFTRREFITTIMAGVALGNSCNVKQKQESGLIPTRPLGSTGENLSIICIGGWDIAAKMDEKLSIDMMHEAIDNGVNFFDNCWEYHDGYAEEVMGKALKEGKREKVFLMTKVCGRTYKDAKQHLEDSLTRMQTDMIDLWQFHAIKWDDDPQLVMNLEKGALKAALEAKKQGKIRYIGFTGHALPERHLEMLNTGFEWDAVQMPLNILDAHYMSFQHNVLPVCNKKNIGALGMKSLAAQNGRIVKDLGVSANLARRYSLSLPITSLVCGIQTKKELQHDMELAKNFKPLTEEEVKEILAIAEPESRDGHIEVYKTQDWGCNWHHNKYS